MDRVAVVTGSSSGIGLFVTKTLLSQGYMVIGGSLDETDIDNTHFLDIELDVRDPKSVINFFKDVESETEVIDLFVDCAGVSDQSSLQETDIFDFKNNIETNAVGTFSTYKELEKFLIEDETMIISFLPIAVKENYKFTLAYSASQNAKESILKQVKAEWRKYQVQFSLVYLGAVNTPMWDEFDEVEIDKMIQVEELSDFITFMISKPNSLNVDEITLSNKYSIL
jgi:NADP-dependent 3-hydroxy acid dehydrogenase YdfG